MTVAEREHPLAELVAACTTLRFAPLPEFTDTEPDAGYLRADRALEEDLLPALFERMHRANGPAHRSPAAIHFVRGLLQDVLFATAAGVYLAGRAPAVNLDRLWWQWLREERFGTPRLVAPEVLVRTGGAASEHPAAITLPDDEALDEAIATRLVAAFEPIVAAVRRHTRVGTRTLWGYIDDMLHFYMLNPARSLGRDLPESWRRAESLSRALVATGAPVRSRPRLFTFRPDSPHGVWAVRGVCCLDFRRDDHGMCVTCPLQDDSVRQARLVEQFG